MANPKLDPELRAALNAHAADQQPLGAVFTLEAGPRQSFIPPDEVEDTVQRILRDVEHETGIAPAQVNVFKNMGAFAVVAPATFLSRILNRGEIATAMANQRSEDLLIRLVSSRPVDAPRPGSRRPRK
jgi:hypothetical protein